MKKRWFIGWVTLCIAAVIIISLICCVPNYGIRMSVANVTSTGAELIINRMPGIGSVITGSSYFLERYSSNGWTPVPELPKEHETAWTMEAYAVGVVPMLFRKNWEWRYGPLPAGTYRVGKSFIRERKFTENEYLTLYAEFQIDPA